MIAPWRDLNKISNPIKDINLGKLTGLCLGLLSKSKKATGIIGVINRLKRSFENRGKEVKQIKYHIENSKYKTIICGDLNDTPISYAYAEISEDKYDAFKKSGIGLGSTYFNIPSLRIDYIFYDKTFKSRNFTVYQEKFSDHKAISADIVINPKWFNLKLHS